ncbi:gamma-aminobutyric acid receptor subunit alpha-2-like [Gigantopelta aegis]|uniref:gamma-aminobutyric acid receptor subunit alpha-2-like n=1 Tax=Gigantopelta aegis TaxID=1735272 RepID=UPI001B88DC93|nr:gamma-aminobutyric acid receptor subunit alpha-2-like [Gigantopelta aegis]
MVAGRGFVNTLAVKQMPLHHTGDHADLLLSIQHDFTRVYVTYTRLAADGEVNKLVTSILNKLLDKYSKEVRPGIGMEPLHIETDISVRSFGSISETRMDYSFQCYLRQRWHDDRLKFNTENITEFTLSNRFLQFIWKPNTYFINGKNSKAHNITVPNAFVRIRQDGRLYMSRRLTVNARCPMKLYRYPMGKVVCPLELGSYGYSTDDIIYHWKDDKRPVIDIYPGVTMAIFDLDRIEAFNRTKYTEYGEVSRLEAKIHLKRPLGFYLLQTYFPCYLITALSWVSFWINRDAAPARVLLGVTTILSTAAIGMTVREGIPRVPYATALDIFLNACLIYQMAALIEYAAVNYFTKMPKSNVSEEDEGTCLPPSRKIIYSNVNEIEREREILLGNNAVLELEEERLRQPCYKMMWHCITGNADFRQHRDANYDGTNSVSSIDMIARFLFPGTFIFANTVYWLAFQFLWTDDES